MVCPKCGSPWALIWMGDSYKDKDHQCTKCKTWFHEDNPINALKIMIEEIRVSAWLQQKKEYFGW